VGVAEGDPRWDPMALPVGIITTIITMVLRVTARSKLCSCDWTQCPHDWTSGSSVTDKNQPFGILSRLGTRDLEMIRLLVKIEAFLFIYCSIILTIKNYM
jgi:hypothetical protein